MPVATPVLLSTRGSLSVRVHQRSRTAMSDIEEETHYRIRSLAVVVTGRRVCGPLRRCLSLNGSCYRSTRPAVGKESWMLEGESGRSRRSCGPECCPVPSKLRIRSVTLCAICHGACHPGLTFRASKIWLLVHICFPQNVSSGQS